MRRKNVFCFTIARRDFYATYTARVTMRPVPMRWPSMNDPGHPAEAGEFEAEVGELFADDGEDKPKPLDCPAWLKTIIEEQMQEDSDIYRATMEETA